MTATLTAERLRTAVKPDPAQRLLRRLADRVENYFHLPVVFGEGSQLIIQPWLFERIVVRVIDLGDHSGDMRILIARLDRHRDHDAESGFTEWSCDWPSDPENFLETRHLGNTEDHLSDGVSVADDLSSFLTAWLTYAGATHLIR